MINLVTFFVCPMLSVRTLC